MLPDASRGIQGGATNANVTVDPRQILQPSIPGPTLTGYQAQPHLPDLPPINPAPNHPNLVAGLSSVRSRAQSAPPVLQKASTREAPPLVTGEPGPGDLPAGSPYSGSTGTPGIREKRKSVVKPSQASEESSKLRKTAFVSYIPPIEYMDVSNVFIPLKQLLLLAELVFYLYEAAVCFARIHIFSEYMQTLSHHVFYGALVAPVAIVLAAIFAFRSINGMFAINFATPSHPKRALFRLAALITSRIIFGIIIIIAAAILKNEIVSDEQKEVIAKNIAHLIQYATKEPDYMEEINRLQQTFHCCGTVTSIEVENTTYTANDHPWNMWFATYSLDETYPSIIRELYSLPWSCCNMTAGAKCEHIGISRYLRKFSTPTDYNDVEAFLQANEMNWNPSEFDHYSSRNELAVGTLYASDCSIEMFREVVTATELVEQEMYRAGVVMVGTSLIIVITAAHLCIIVAHSSPPATSFASSAIKQNEEAAEHSAPRAEPQVLQGAIAPPIASNPQ